MGEQDAAGFEIKGPIRKDAGLFSFPLIYPT